jgi:hypothetical protein
VGNSFFGVIPSQIGELSSLLELELGRNFFTGKIPTTVGNMTSLEVFEIADNQITGLIPSEIGVLKNLQVLIIDTNVLGSPIPAEMGELASLGRKRIRNKITLRSIQILTSFMISFFPSEVVSMSRNQFSEPFPTLFGSLGSLSKFVFLETFRPAK